MTKEAVAVAKEKRERGGPVRELANGHPARFVPVPQSVIQAALALQPEPRVPMWYNPDKEREEPNPNHPDYLEAVERYEREQYGITFDCYAMFGVELVGGLPEDDGWLKKLKLMQRLGRLDLSAYDLEDDIDLEFVYKRHFAMGNEDYVAVGLISGINPEEVRRAARGFPGDEARGAD